MPKHHDLIIRWNNKKSSVNLLMQAGSVSIHGLPKYFRPGKQVAIVSQNNNIQLMFKATAIEGPKRVTLANGDSLAKGYIIRADKKTIQRPKPPIPSPIHGWFAIGQFRYFNAAKMEPVLIDDTFSRPGKYITNISTKISGNVFIIHTKGIPGLPHNNPEAILVDQYVAWMDENTRFGHNHIRVDNLYVDLFDLTHWQLIEAKAVTSREKLRMAIGQLRDYKRYYDRSPSLAVLLPARPTDSCIKLLTDNHIAAIWRNPSGSFSTKRWQS